MGLDLKPAVGTDRRAGVGRRAPLAQQSAPVSTVEVSMSLICDRSIEFCVCRTAPNTPPTGMQQHMDWWVRRTTRKAEVSL